MQIAAITIQDFRHIKKMELDFIDSLGRVREITALVGPNTSGKTTVLDAIAATTGLITEIAPLRPDFVLSPRTVVRRGAIRARITAMVRISSEEVEATKKLFALSNKKDFIPEVKEIKVTWTYPAKGYKSGQTQCSPSQSWKILKGRAMAARLLSTGRADLSWFGKTGGVFTFDQQRTGMGKTIRRDIWEIIQGTSHDISDALDSRYTTNPRTILLALAVQALVPSEHANQLDQFKMIQDKFNDLCAPNKLVGAVRNELGDLDLRFKTNGYEYGYDGLSSGEQMILLFLIKMVTEHINHSIVLIDELELHHHPIWQRKFLNMLPKIGTKNQFIFTTHSPYLRDYMPKDSIIDLGQLEDISPRKKRK